MKKLLPALLTLFFLAGCQGPFSDVRIQELEAMPTVERLTVLEGLSVEHRSHPEYRRLWSTAVWEETDGLSQSERIQEMKSRLRADPENPMLSKLLGDAFFDFYQGEGGRTYLDSALFAYENAALKAPDYLPAVGSVGSLYDEKEDLDQAIFWYEKVLEIDPGHVPTLCNLGASYYNRGESNRAMDMYRRALEIDPESLDAHYNLGVAFAEAQIYREAVREWEIVVSLDPESPVALQAADNAALLKGVLEETVYRAGRKVRKSSMSGREKEVQAKAKAEAQIKDSLDKK